MRIGSDSTIPIATAMPTMPRIHSQETTKSRVP